MSNPKPWNEMKVQLWITLDEVVIYHKWRTEYEETLEKKREEEGKRIFNNAANVRGELKFQ